MSNGIDDKIMFQFVMNYKAYRIRMIVMRGLITLAVAGSLAAFAVKSVMLGILLPTIALFLGALTVIHGLGNEQSYTVYADRVVLRKRGADRRVTVPIAALVGIKYKTAFYEKQFATGTVTVFADIKGKTKKYRLRHIFGARPAVQYLTEQIDGNNK